MDVKTAMSIVVKTFPDKKITGNPAEYNGKYTFNIVSKDYVEGTPNWDATIAAVDQKTGKVETLNAFADLDYGFNAKPILSY